MRNLNYLNCVELDEFDLIKNSKHNATQQALDVARPQIIRNYDRYLNRFNRIHSIAPSTFVGQIRTDLKGCYDIITDARDNLLGRILNNQITEFRRICPYCLILPRTSYDHYIPSARYPVFSVLAKNLIPCCSICNGKKLSFWRHNGQRAIIHFYIDQIPNLQFLFGTLNLNANNIPSITFHLQQTIGITNNFFSIAELHFDRLNLLERYTEEIVDLLGDNITEVDAIRSEFGNALTPQAISNIFIRKANSLRQIYGINYWKAIAMDLLANSAQYINTL